MTRPSDTVRAELVAVLARSHRPCAFESGSSAVRALRVEPFIKVQHRNAYDSGMVGEPSESAVEDEVLGFRRFILDFRSFSMQLANRFVSEYSLAEARVLFTFRGRTSMTVGELRAELGIDRGYLSRILTRFEQEGLIVRTNPESDRRRQHVTVTEAGATKIALLDQRVAQLLNELFMQLGPDEGAELIAHMERIRSLLFNGAIEQWLASSE